MTAMSDSTAEETSARVVPFALHGRDIPVRSMTNGQKLALAMALEMAKKKPGMAMIRVWAVIEYLVSPEDWDYIDTGFLCGALSLDELLQFLRDVVGYKWEAADDAPGAAESVA